MAALKFVVLAAVLASVVALPPTTPSDSRRAGLEERRRNAEKECSVDNPSPRGPELALCYTLCLFKSLGALDKDGRYVESRMADLLWIVGGFSKETSNMIAKGCNSMNEQIQPGCERARQVSLCIHEETEKLIHNFTQLHSTPARNISKRDTLQQKRSAADAACRHIKQYDICHELCLYKSVGALDKDGLYIESKAVDLVGIVSPNFTQEQIKQMAKSCTSVNENIVAGCNRARQVSECLQEERYKITGVRE